MQKYEDFDHWNEMSIIAPPILSLFGFAAVIKYDNELSFYIFLLIALSVFLCGGVYRSIISNSYNAVFYNSILGASIGVATSTAMAGIFDDGGHADPGFHAAVMGFGIWCYGIPSYLKLIYRGITETDWLPKTQIVRRLSFMTLMWIFGSLMFSGWVMYSTSMRLNP